MRPSVFVKAVRDQRWLILGFGVGAGALAALLVPLYPFYSDAMANFKVPAAFQAIIGDVDLGTGVGFLAAEFFSWVPALLVVYAIIQGTGALAGEEGVGTLELVLARPIGRSRLFIEEALAIVAGTIIIVCLTVLGFLIGRAITDIDVSLVNISIAVGVLLPFTVAFAAVSLLLGALLPNRRQAAAVATALAYVSYLANSLGTAIEPLEAMRRASLFYYLHAAQILKSGMVWSSAIVPGLVALLAVGLGAAVFERRDIRVGLDLSFLLRRGRPASVSRS